VWCSTPSCWNRLGPGVYPALHRAPPRALTVEEVWSEVHPHWRSPLSLQIPLLWRLGRRSRPRGVQKPLLGWEQKISGNSLGCSWRDGVETRGSENETRLGAGGPLRRVVAGLATMLAPGSQLRTAWLGVCVCVGLEPADGDDLVSGPDLDGEGAWATGQDGPKAA
jgi:hypothetical protein